METAQFGGTPKGGIKRLTVSDEDKRVRDWFKAECEKLGCTVEVDEVGNMFATRPGRRKDVAPIAMGSHLDTQPTGGKFDGVLGVLGPLEVMRTLVDMGYESNAPLMIVNWTNEEGSRFAPAMLCSGVYAGVFTPEFAYSREDRQGITLGAMNWSASATRASTRRGRSNSLPCLNFTSSRDQSLKLRTR